MKLLVALAAVTTGIAAAVPPPAAFRFPASGARAERHALLLAIDDLSLPYKKNLCYYLARPQVRSEPVLTPSRDNPQAPDYLATHFYGTVLHDGGKFRMWYYGASLGRNPDWPPEYQEQFPAQPRHDQEYGPVCYAESPDGIHWVKPKLGQLLWKGSRANNAVVLPNPNTEGAFVVKDETDPNPQRRYKMVYEYCWQGPRALPGEDAGHGTVRAAWSPDGLRWTAGPRDAVQSFFEPSAFYNFNGLWIISGHKARAGIGAGEGGSDRGREGYVHVATDFPHFLPEHVESFALSEPRDPKARGPNGRYDQAHLGVGAAGFGNVAVGLYGRWHNADYNEAFNDISADLGLVVSNDGIRFREPVKDFLFLTALGAPVTPVPGRHHNTVLIQSGNGILNVGAETRIYFGRWRNADFRRGENPPTDYYGEVALATLPRDRWGALGLFPAANEGSVISTSVLLPEQAVLTLNAEEAQAMRVEVLDDRFRPLARFSGASAGMIALRHGLDCPVTWPGVDLYELAGQTVRFRVTLQRRGSDEPRVYALNLATAGGAIR